MLEEGSILLQNDLIFLVTSAPVVVSLAIPGI
jgi:hypothetical protein